MLYVCPCLFVLCIFNAQGQNFEVPINRKVIDEKGFKEIVYTTKKTPYPNTDQMYHWYKARGVHTSQGNYAGELLDGEYLRYFPDNQLAEKGSFKNGLKVLVWNTWHQNGNLSTRSVWKNGKISGKYIEWDSVGNITETGRYRKGIKIGKWLFPIKGDTIRYKKGMAVVKDTSIHDSIHQRESLFKRIFRKKDEGTNDLEKVEDSRGKGFFVKPFGKREDKDKINRERVKSRNGQPTDKQSNKEGFLKRLFGKKEKREGGNNA